MKQTSISDLIGRDLGLSKKDIESLAKGADALYRSQEIKGRKIEVPDPSLKLVQCWISDLLRTVDSNLPPCVAAYEEGCSIVGNASIHCKNAHILKLDIKDFFHSCKRPLVWRVFSEIKVGFEEGHASRRLRVDEADLLTGLACYKDGLSVGAPSSPAIANRIMVPFDAAILDGIPSTMAYSRYSDDMAFSSNEWIDVRKISDFVSGVLSTGGFTLNEKKTTCFGKGDRRTVTGVVIGHDGSLSIGSRKKRQIKRDLYALLVRGEGEPLRILGSLYFALQVEPGWTANVLAKYSNYGSAKEGGVIHALRRLAAN